MKALVNPKGSNLSHRIVNATPTEQNLHYTVYVPKIYTSSLVIRKKEEKPFAGAASNNFIGQLWRSIERFDVDRFEGRGEIFNAYLLRLNHFS